MRGIVFAVVCLITGRFTTVLITVVPPTADTF